MVMNVSIVSANAFLPFIATDKMKMKEYFMTIAPIALITTFANAMPWKGEQYPFFAYATSKQGPVDALP